MEHPPKLDHSEEKAVAKQQQSPYEQAKVHIQNWKSLPAESSFSYDISRNDWIQLQTDFDMIMVDDKNTLPRLFYDASRSTLMIQCSPSPLHEAVVMSVIRGSMRVPLAPSTEDQLHFHGDEAHDQFSGKYEGSSRVPDFAISQRKGLDNLPRFILEVGNSESEKDLEADAVFWIEAMPTVSLVLLVKIVEVTYKGCPLDNHMDNHKIVDLGYPLELSDINSSLFTVGGAYGPIKHLEDIWAGTVTTVYFETWKRNAAGKAQKHGRRHYIISQTHGEESPRLRLSDFLDDITPEDDRVMDFGWDRFRKDMTSILMQTAGSRCREWFKECQKNAGNDQRRDPTYQGSSE